MKKIAALSAMVCLLATGCATIFKGNSEEVRFDSKPAGAEVWIDGQNMGVAPLSLKLESKKTYTIEFRADGKTKTVRLTNHMAAGYLVLDILFGLVPIIVDAATGAWYKLDSNNVIVDIGYPNSFHPAPVI